MLTLALVVLFQAAPAVRTDGVWLPPKVAARAINGTASELELSTGVAFAAVEVTIGYGMEDETRSWRESETGLEVRSGSEWRPLQWVEVRTGVVKTDIKRAGQLEELSFVPGSIEQLKKDRAEKLKASLLARLAGKWAAPGHTLELAAESRFDGRPVALRTALCNLHCEGKAGVVCADVGEPGDSRLYLLLGKKLAEVSVQGACAAGEGTGVEPVEGGLVFERR